VMQKIGTNTPFFRIFKELIQLRNS
jgi:hypothetical protein